MRLSVSRCRRRSVEYTEQRKYTSLRKAACQRCSQASNSTEHLPDESPRPLCSTSTAWTRSLMIFSVKSDSMTGYEASDDAYTVPENHISRIYFGDAHHRLFKAEMRVGHRIQDRPREACARGVYPREVGRRYILYCKISLCRESESLVHSPNFQLDAARRLPSAFSTGTKKGRRMIYALARRMLGKTCKVPSCGAVSLYHRVKGRYNTDTASSYLIASQPW